MKTQPFVYLASQSPRRQQLLAQVGVSARLLLPGPEEDAEALEWVRPGESAATYVQRVTQLKWQAAVQRCKQRGLEAAPILCADTTVAVGRDILGKPENAQHAAQMLDRLSGGAHRVLTAVVVGTPRKQRRALSTSVVRFDALTPAQIRRYVHSGEPMGKAGAYAIQGVASTFVRSIQGSYSGIMGLPLFETAQLLRDFGFSV